MLAQRVHLLRVCPIHLVLKLPQLVRLLLRDPRPRRPSSPRGHGRPRDLSCDGVPCELGGVDVIGDAETARVPLLVEPGGGREREARVGRWGRGEEVGESG